MNDINISDLREFAEEYKINGRSKQEIVDKLKIVCINTARLIKLLIRLNRQREYNHQVETLNTKGYHALSIHIKQDYVTNDSRTTKYQRAKLFQQLVDKILRYAPTTKCWGDDKIGMKWLDYLIAKHLFDACTIKDSHYMMGITLNRDTKTKHVDAFIPEAFAQKIIDCHRSLIIVTMSLSFNRQIEHGHENLLIIDKKHQTYERFDPNGYTDKSEYAWVDTWLQGIFIDYLPSRQKTYHFLSDIETCPLIGPQIRAGNNRHCAKDRQGYCVTFSIMFAHLRMLLPGANRTEIYELWTATDLLPFILSYQTWMEETVSLLNEV